MQQSQRGAKSPIVHAAAGDLGRWVRAGAHISNLLAANNVNYNNPRVMPM
jgi:hypothetical protein